MNFSEIEGLELPKQVIGKIISDQLFEHSLLFFGPRGIGKSLMANHIAKSLLVDGSRLHARALSEKLFESSQHPDFIVVKAEGETIKIDQIRSAMNFLSTSPSVGNKKILYVKQIQKMSLEACNSILKILEEPTPDCTIILSAEVLEDVPETIISRCLVIRFPSLSDEIIRRIYTSKFQLENTYDLKMLVHLSNGGINKLHLEKLKELREAYQFCEDFLQSPRQTYLEGTLSKFKQFIDEKIDIHVYQILYFLFREKLLRHDNPSSSSTPALFASSKLKYLRCLETILEYSKARENNANKMFMLNGLFRTCINI